MKKQKNAASNMVYDAVDYFFPFMLIPNPFPRRHRTGVVFFVQKKSPGSGTPNHLPPITSATCAKVSPRSSRNWRSRLSSADSPFASYQKISFRFSPANSSFSLSVICLKLSSAIFSPSPYSSKYHSKDHYDPLELWATLSQMALCIISA